MIRKIHNTLRATTLALLVAFSATSCLEKYPGDAFHTDLAMKTFADAEQMVVGIYSTYKSSGLYSGSLTLAPDIQSDLVYAVEGNSNQYGNIWQWDILPTTPEIEAVYASLYTIIGQCNFYLDRVDALKASLTDDQELKDLDTYTGEVYCARALAYSELAKCFCEAYDPVIDGPDSAQPHLGVVLRSSYNAVEVAKRSTLHETYRFILDDLAKAEELMDEDEDRADLPFFSEAAAHAIHARVALYMKDWKTAVEESTKVIDNKNFALADVHRDPDALMRLWHLDSSSEIIFKVGFTPTSYGAPLGQVFLNYDMINYYPDYVPAQWIISSFGNGDMRAPAYFQEVTTGFAHGLTWPLLIKYRGNLGFIDLKIFHVSMPKPLRLAEQYLILAEAQCELGNIGKAKDVLTDLLSTRFVANVGVNLPEDREGWLKVISEERAKELYMEGFRLHDLKRWGMGINRTPQSESQKEGSSLRKNADDKYFVWPIPKHEIEAPGSQVVQNGDRK